MPTLLNTHKLCESSQRFITFMPQTVSIEKYLDRACTSLRVSPYEADDVRAELRAHLEELIESYSAGGADRAEATDLALAWFGDVHQLHDCLDQVHQGDAWWVSRLKGFVLGALIGILLGLILPLGGHIEFLTRHLPFLAVLAGNRTGIFLNSLLVGSFIGLLSSGERSLFVGWALGSLIWLAEYAAFWIHSVATSTVAPESSFTMLSSVLLSPLLGGIFGAAVALGTASVLSRLAMIRPEIK
jgi:hypothetical protein